MQKHRAVVTGAVTALLIGVGASAANAQIAVSARDVPPGHRPPPGMCRIWIDGVPPGRQPGVMDCATARSAAPRGSRIIYGDLTPFPGSGRNRGVADCRYDQQSRPSLGEIIFGRRTGDYGHDCRYDSRRQVGAWYEVGRDMHGNRIYQRSVRARDGRVAVQRARMDRNGRLVVFDTRYPRSGFNFVGLTDDVIWSRAGGYDRPVSLNPGGGVRFEERDDDGRRASENRGVIRTQQAPARGREVRSNKRRGNDNKGRGKSNGRGRGRS
jgi:hypothetical protein